MNSGFKGKYTTHNFNIKFKNKCNIIKFKSQRTYYKVMNYLRKCAIRFWRCLRPICGFENHVCPSCDRNFDTQVDLDEHIYDQNNQNCLDFYRIYVGRDSLRAIEVANPNALPNDTVLGDVNDTTLDKDLCNNSDIDSGREGSSTTHQFNSKMSKSKKQFMERMLKLDPRFGMPRNYTCPSCSGGFYTKSDLKLHLKTTQCNERIEDDVDEEDVDKHATALEANEKHLEENPIVNERAIDGATPEFVCPSCQFAFFYEDELKTHLIETTNTCGQRIHEELDIEGEERDAYFAKVKLQQLLEFIAENKNELNHLIERDVLDDSCVDDDNYDSSSIDSSEVSSVLSSSVHAEEEVETDPEMPELVVSTSETSSDRVSASVIVNMDELSDIHESDTCVSTATSEEF